MRVGIVYFPINNRSKLSVLSTSLGEGIRAQGHQVDIINGCMDSNTKLSIYNYIAVGVEPLNFLGGKVHEKTSNFLANAGWINGKRSYAFSMKSSLRPLKSLSKLMRLMEHEGMFLKKSDVVSSKAEAEVIGKHLHIS